MARPVDVFVVDASVAVKWHLQDEDHADEARLLLTRFALEEVGLIAPDQIRYEVPSAIAVATLGRKPRLTRHQGQEAIEEFLSLGLELVDSDDLILNAYSLAHQHGCAFYDALYLALAEERGVPLITAGKKFYGRTSFLPHVTWLGHYSNPT